MFRFKNFKLEQSNLVFKLTTDSLLLAGLTQIETTDLKLLDIGTGTGVLTFLLKDRFPHLHIDAIDVQQKAVDLAKQNLKNFHLPKHIRIWKEDFIHLSESDKYDIIISNPPYFTNQLNSKENWKSQSRHTIWSWQDFFQKCAHIINPNGRLILIIPATQEEIISFAKEQGWLLVNRIAIKDQAGSAIKWYFLSFSTSAAHPVRESGFILKNEDGTYTDEYLKILDGWIIDSFGNT